jgi:ABC-type glycerol-3-phosphate transport system permease component
MEGRAFGLGQVGLGAALACIAALIGLALTVAALAIARGAASDAQEDGSGRTMPRPRRGRGAAGLVLASATGVVLLPAAWLVAQAGRVGPGGSIAGNVVAVWTGGLGGAFATSLEIALVVTAATVALAVPAAFGLEQLRSRRWRVAGLVLLATGLFQPADVLLIPLYALLQWAGLFNTTAGVILPEVAHTLPLAVLLLWIARRGLPAELLQSAAVDGAAPRQVLGRIVLPLTLPTVAVVAVWAFLSSWNDYMLPTVVLQDDTLQTVPVALGHFIGRIDTEYALIATGALLASAPLLAVYAGGYGVLGLGLRRLRLTPRRNP